VSEKFNPYLILQVRREATREEIKRSYRRLVSKYHPDVCDAPDAADKFRQVVSAYEQIDAALSRGPVSKPIYKPFRPTPPPAPPRPAHNGFASESRRKPRRRYSMNLQSKMSRLSLFELMARYEGSQNRFVRMAAVEALGRRKCLSAVHTLTKYATKCTDRDILLAIIEALGNSEVKQAADTLAAFLTHRDSVIADASRRALDRLARKADIPTMEHFLRTGPLLLRARVVRFMRRVFRPASAA